MPDAEGRNSQKLNDINKLLKPICIFLNLNVNLYNPGRVSHMKCIFKLSDKTERNNYATGTIKGPAGAIQVVLNL